MRAKKLLFMATAVAASFSSCTNDDILGITAHEEYTRNFIKEFGLIDPAQDWNLAEGTKVTVKVGDTPAHVKAYMKVDKTYYLVADLEGVSGTLDIPFDMPEGTRDILVKINNTRYYTTPGGTVDPNGVGSRGFEQSVQGDGKPAGEIVESTGLGKSGKYGGVQVTIQKNEHGRYLTLEENTMTEVVNILEENPSDISAWEYSNMNVEGVTDNFSATVKEFYLFPEYWQTSHTADNIIGIYWEVSEGTEGAENVKVTDPDGTEHSYWIIRVPVLQNPSKYLTPCKTEKTYYQNFSDIPEWEDIFDALMKKFPENYFIADGKNFLNEHGWPFTEGKKIHLRSDGVYREIAGTSDGEYNDLGNEICKDIHSIYPNYYVSEYSNLVYDKLVDAPYSSDDPHESLVTNAPYYKSEGIHVTLDDFHTIGFYIQQFDNIMFSQTKLNLWVEKNGKDGNPEARQPSYTATLVQDTDTEGNTKRHLCFEDWYLDNWDINDMVFRIYGLDALANQDPDKPIETGKLLDEDKGDVPPTPPTPPTPPSGTETEVEGPYQWLLAVEDLGATDDFDFNDIVIGISSTIVSVKGELPDGARVKGQTRQISWSGDDGEIQSMYNKVTFKALAAGGTRKAYVFYGDELLYPDGKSRGSAEWHSWFGNGQYSSSVMINTGYGTDNVEGATCTIYFGADDEGELIFSLENFSVDAHGSGFQIGIDSEGNIGSDEISADYFTEAEEGGSKYFVKPANAGAAPQMFLIPDLWDNGNGKWAWPKERNHISTCYTGFADWVRDGKGAADWYKSPSGYVIRY